MRPLIIGIAGGTGSGKSTIAAKIAAALPQESVVVLDHDSYYRDRPDLSLDERANLNFDHPDALDSQLLVTHLGRLREGFPIDVPVYDFKSHRRLAEARTVHPTPVVVVEGILVFVDAALRDALDIKVFVDTDADIRVFRRIRRDLEQRGRSFQAVRDQYYRTVRPMHMQFVEPSKRWADLIIPEGGDNHVAIDLIIGKLKNVLSPSSR
jgi:uridine kinase